MSQSNTMQLERTLDLVLERTVDVPREKVWLAWTTPEYLKKWFTPAPWTTVECEINLRPGGIFRTVMRSPEGQEFPNLGCFLEIVENEKLVWTDALEPGFRPAIERPKEHCDIGFFTAIITLATHGQGTKYTARVLHRNEADLKRHEELGFRDGWGTAFDQLVEVARKI